MTTVIADEEGGFKLYSKGASEVLLELCTSVVSTTGKPKEFTKEDAENLFRDFIDPWQKEGLRILCLTTKNISSSGCFLDCYSPLFSRTIVEIKRFALRAAILHECQNYLGGGDGLGGSEKNRGTVITSLQLAFRWCDRNFTPFTIH